MPLTVFPLSSNGGDQSPIPMTLGITRRRAPDTPDLAGKPTLKANKECPSFPVFKVCLGVCELFVSETNQMGKSGLNGIIQTERWINRAHQKYICQQ